jgi:FkbM family methyltransferase
MPAPWPAPWNGAPALAVRMLVRRLIKRLAGKSEAGLWAHALYHALLRRTGGFGLDEPAATLELLGCLAGRAGTILDVGANVGRYGWFLARRRRPGVLLYGFEPNPEALALAQRNLASLPDVEVLPFGLGTRAEDAILSVPRDSQGNPVSGLGFVDTSQDGTTAAGSDAIPVAIRSLDGLLASGMVQVRSPVLLKMDIEGYEAAALAGMPDFLDRHRPWIFFECRQSHLRRAGTDWQLVFGPLSQFGYVILAETDGRFAAVAQPDEAIDNYFALTLPGPVPLPVTPGEIMDSLIRAGSLPDAISQ